MILTDIDIEWYSMSIQFNSMIFNVRTLVMKILASTGRSIINMRNLNESPHALGQMEKMNNLTWHDMAISEETWKEYHLAHCEQDMNMDIHRPGIPELNEGIRHRKLQCLMLKSQRLQQQSLNQALNASSAVNL